MTAYKNMVEGVQINVASYAELSFDLVWRLVVGPVHLDPDVIADLPLSFPQDGWERSVRYPVLEREPMFAR